MNTACIIIDTKEQETSIPKFLDIQKIPYSYDTLEIGDYVVIGSSCNIVIERKTMKDFVASVVDGRLNNQLYYLSTECNIPVLIIEGFVTDALRHRKRMKRTQVNSALASAILKRSPDGNSNRINVLMVETPFDTVDIIAGWYRRLQEGEVFRFLKLSRAKITPERRSIAVLASFPRIGEKKATALIKKFKTLENVFNASTEELNEVVGIGKTISKGIHQTLQGEYDE